MRNYNKSTLPRYNETDNYKYLIETYEKIGRSEINKNNIKIGCFYITLAYIFSLETGSERAKKLHRILKMHGREE